MKFIAGALIIAAAACIMLPGIMGYVGKLWQLGLLIVCVLAIGWLLANVVARFMVLKQSKLMRGNKDAGEKPS